VFIPDAFFPQVLHEVIKRDLTVNCPNTLNNKHTCLPPTYYVTSTCTPAPGGTDHLGWRHRTVSERPFEFVLLYLPL